MLDRSLENTSEHDIREKPSIANADSVLQTTTDEHLQSIAAFFESITGKPGHEIFNHVNLGNKEVIGNALKQMTQCYKNSRGAAEQFLAAVYPNASKNR